jgi:hypothetical protein
MDTLKHTRFILPPIPLHAFFRFSYCEILRLEYYAIKINSLVIL